MTSLILTDYKLLYGPEITTDCINSELKYIIIEATRENARRKKRIKIDNKINEISLTRLIATLISGEKVFELLIRELDTETGE